MIYLAGSCSSEQRTLMKGIANKLRNSGREVYCPFELKIDNAWAYSQESWANEVFKKDIEALDKCELFLMISPGRVSSAGTNWEQGYAYAKGKDVIVIQYTDEQTSLMTFCGCTKFINSDTDELLNDIIDLIYLGNNSNNCKTILT